MFSSGYNVNYCIGKDAYNLEVYLIVRQNTYLQRLRHRIPVQRKRAKLLCRKGITNEPQRCPECRAARKIQQRGGRGGYGNSEREMFPAVCAQCGRDTMVPFRPSNDKPVYCKVLPATGTVKKLVLKSTPPSLWRLDSLFKKSGLVFRIFAF